MIYKAKYGSKAYEYIKSICEAEDKEFKAYVKRVEDSVGFEFDKFVWLHARLHANPDLRNHFHLGRQGKMGAA